MADALKKEKRIYTYSDYAAWSDDKRYEVIGGESYSMAPGPSDIHQGSLGELFTEFSLYLRGKKCRAFVAPFDVVLPEEGETFETASNIVQPDIIIICDKDKITRRGCYGTPDLVVEILSPSTASNDMKVKRRLYEKFGVKEYWIVDPVHKTVQIYKGDEQGKYSFPETYAGDDKIQVDMFNGELEIDLSIIFTG